MTRPNDPEWTPWQRFHAEHQYYLRDFFEYTGDDRYLRDAYKNNPEDDDMLKFLAETASFDDRCGLLLDNDSE